MSATVKLSAPLATHQGPIEEITLRDLKARDLVKMKVSPYSYINLGDDSGKPVQNKRLDQRFEMRYDIAMGYISLLTGIDEVLLGDMSGSDLQKVNNAFVAMWSDAQGE